MPIFWVTQRGKPRDVFHEYVSPNPLDLPYPLMRITQEQCGQAQMECEMTTKQDTLEPWLSPLLIRSTLHLLSHQITPLGPPKV